MKRRALLILSICCLLLISVNAVAQSFGEVGTEVHPFSSELPEPLGSLFIGSQWEGYHPVSGSYSTRFYEYNCAQILLEKGGQYRLCVFFYDGTNWVLSASTEKALLPGKQPLIVAEADYGESFDLVYENSDGTVETYSFFRGSDTWRFNQYVRTLQGIEEMVIYTDARALQANSVPCFNAHSVLLPEFDAAAFPRTLEQAIQEGELVPEAQTNIGMIRQVITGGGFPSVTMFDAPSRRANVRMRYFPGVEVEVLAIADGFVHIQVGNMDGYVSREDIAIGQEKADVYPWKGIPGLTRAQMPKSTVSFFESASWNATILNQLETARYVRVLGINVDSQWLQIAIPELNTPLTSISHTLVEEAPIIGFLLITEVTQTDNLHSAVVENPNPSDRLNLRVGPDKSCTSLGKYYNGVEVEFLFGTENAESWRHVIIEGVVGYVDSSFLDFSSDGGYVYLPPLAKVQGTSNGLELRSEPIETADSKGTYENGMVVEVLAVCGSYAHVRTQEGICGYMALKQLGGEPKSAASAKLKVLKDTPLYPEKSKDAMSEHALSAGESVAIYRRPAQRWMRSYDYDLGAMGELFLAANDEWIYVAGDGKWGYVPADCLESPWNPSHPLNH